MCGADWRMCWGFLIINCVPVGVLSALSLLASHGTQKKNQRQEIEEKDAFEKGLMPRNYFRYEQGNKLCGGLCVTTCLFDFSAGATIDSMGIYSLGAGMGIRGASYYVMRAEQPPYSKSQLKKLAKNLGSKLVDKVKDFVPSPVPEPVSISVNCKDGLENYFSEI